MSPGGHRGAPRPAGQRAAAVGLVAELCVAAAVGAAAQRAGGGVRVVGRDGPHDTGRRLVDGDLHGGVGAPAPTGRRGRRPVRLLTTRRRVLAHGDQI